MFTFGSSSQSLTARASAEEEKLSIRFDRATGHVDDEQPWFQCDTSCSARETRPCASDAGQGPPWFSRYDGDCRSIDDGRSSSASGCEHHQRGIDMNLVKIVRCLEKKFVRILICLPPHSVQTLFILPNLIEKSSLRLFLSLVGVHVRACVCVCVFFISNVSVCRSRSRSLSVYVLFCCEWKIRPHNKRIKSTSATSNASARSSCLKRRVAFSVDGLAVYIYILRWMVKKKKKRSNYEIHSGRVRASRKHQSNIV